MDADRELNEAVDRRIKREMDFKEEIISKINAIISELEFCDPTNAASTLNLSQENLREIIGKLNDYDIISADKSDSISDILKTKNLRRVPEVSPAVTGNIPTAPARDLPAGRRPPPAETAPPAGPLTLQQRKENWLNRGRNAVAGLQNPNPPTLTPSVPQAVKPSGGRRTKRKRKTRR